MLELHLTHGAVSRRISALESLLGRPLFDRGARGVTLTSEGAVFYREVDAALAHLRAAVDAFESRSASRQVRIGMSPCVAARWLMPRLARLQSALPDVDIVVHADRKVADAPSAHSDFAIRECLESEADDTAQLLMRETLFPVCAPVLARAGGSEGWRRLTPIHDGTSDAWAEWLAASAVPEQTPAARPMFLDDYTLAIEAAVQGLGVAMGRSVLIENDLACGRLVRLSADCVVSRRSYYLMRSGARALSSSAQRVWNAVVELAKA